MEIKMSPRRMAFLIFCFGSGVVYFNSGDWTVPWMYRDNKPRNHYIEKSKRTLADKLVQLQMACIHADDRFCSIMI
ncbi:unnamed protein product [Natator depressus]